MAAAKKKSVYFYLTYQADSSNKLFLLILSTFSRTPVSRTYEPHSYDASILPLSLTQFQTIIYEKMSSLKDLALYNHMLLYTL